MPLPFAVSDLRQRPEFFGVVADRIWRAWWQAQCIPLEHISGRLQDNMKATAIPFTLVAHDAGVFLGTASVIASDLSERPQLTPWVAAVWVERSARRCGIGSTLVNRASRDCLALGFKSAYLCAQPRMTHFYERLGWTIVERSVGEHRLNVFIQNAVTDGGISRSPR